MTDTDLSTALIRVPGTRGPKRLTADDERYFTPDGAKYEHKVNTLHSKLHQELEKYPDHITAIQKEARNQQKGYTMFAQRGEGIFSGLANSSKTAKVMGVVLGVWAAWELYLGAKWVLKKATEQQAREYGLVSRKQRRSHARDWELHRSIV